LVPSLERLVGAVGLILGRLQKCVGTDPLGETVGADIVVEAFGESLGRLGKGSLIGSKTFDQAFQLRNGFMPSIVARKQALKVPCVF
jgi:hypothetical protein